MLCKKKRVQKVLEGGHMNATPKKYVAVRLIGVASIAAVVDMQKKARNQCSNHCCVKCSLHTILSGYP